MNKEINLILILFLVMSLPPSIFSSQEKNTQQQNQQSESRMKERLKNSEDKINIQLKALEDKINLYIGIGSVFFIFLSFIGYRTIRGWIKNTIETQTDKQVKRFVTRHYLEQLIKEEGHDAIAALLAELEAKGQEKLVDIENLRNDYENSLNNLKNKEIDIKKPLSPETVESLDQFEKKLIRVKDESKYSFDDWFFKGLDEYRRKNYSDAIRSFTRATELDPNDTQSFYNRGNAYDELKEYKKAIEDYSKAIELNPNGVTTLNNRGTTYGNLKEYKKAIKDFNKAIELEPKYSLAYYNRGVSYGFLKQYEQAIKDHNKAIELDPKYHEPYASLAELMIITGDHKKALTFLEKGLPVASEVEDVSILIYLDCIAKRLLKVDSSQSEKKFAELIEKEFETTWSFDEIEEWLQSKKISEEDKKYVIEKTELLKKHAKE